MKLFDFEGVNKISDEETLLRRLTSVRRGEYGAFMLTHSNDYPAMSLHFNRDIAYLHFFPQDGHPGFQPNNMTPDDCPADVHFLQTNGSEADSFNMPDYTLATADIAYVAATEFFRCSILPPSVTWCEL